MEVFLDLYSQNKLPCNEDGRQSAGPLDVTAIQLNTEDINTCEVLHQNASLNKVLQFGKLFHIHPSGRKYFVGDLTKEDDKKRASFMKSWKSHPIASWSGGCKTSDFGKVMVLNQLSRMPAIQEIEYALRNAAQILWQTFQEVLPTPAAFQEEYKRKHHSIGNTDVLEGTGWNAYSINVNYRTAAHFDRKNVEGSYSALVVFNCGEPFLGSFYMLPQYRLGFDLRDGETVLFHTSDQDLHGNSELHVENGSARVAIVL